MWTLIQYNLVPILIALLVGIAVAFWIFRARRAGPRPMVTDAAPTAARPVVAPKRRAAGAEGSGLPDEFAAATRDVAGEILGVDAHPDVPAASGPPDNLQTLKGVGPKLAAQLNRNGITRFDQLARLTDNEIAILDAKLDAFAGRIARDRLVEQAFYLARGDIDGFEAKFGKLGGP
jgi:predicted flap endonuclease-1-like 5' DNA nuclease